MREESSKSGGQRLTSEVSGGRADSGLFRVVAEYLGAALGLDDGWRFTDAGYWSYALPEEMELALEPGFDGIVDLALYDRHQILVWKHKVMLQVPH